MNKPREFWIDEGANGLDLGWYKRDIAEFPNTGTTDGKIHVIEYSAYEEILNKYTLSAVKYGELADKYLSLKELMGTTRTTTNNNKEK